MSSVIVSDQPAPSGNATEPETIVIDLGRQSRRRVRKLRKGKGRLMVKVEDTIDNLRTQGVAGAVVQTVVVIVREEFSIRGLFDDDEDDDD